MPFSPAIVDVVVPTRNRPAKLDRCLRALAAARDRYAFEVHVVDSSTLEVAGEVKAVCDRFPFATLRRHSAIGFGAARNQCCLAGTAPLVVTVDDDVYVDPDSVTRLVDRYCTETGWRVIAGSVSWGAAGSGPARMRRIGYGARTEDERRADFYVTALLLYPRELVRQFPYNERLTSSEDRFMGAVWRSKDVKMLWEPTATAIHDEEHAAYPIRDYEAHIYTNLFDAVMVRRSLVWACCFEFLGFAAGAKLHGRGLHSLHEYASAWWRGNKRFAADRRWLRDLASRAIVGDAPQCPAMSGGGVQHAVSGDWPTAL